MKKQFKYFLLLVLKLFFLENDTFATCTGSASFTTTSPACPNATVTFTNTSTGSADSYIWKWGDATANTTVLNTNNQTHTYAIAGTYVVWLVRIFNTPSCRDSISQNVIVNTNPVASFSFAPNNACSLTPVQFLNTSTGTGLTYSWNLGNSTTSTLLSPSVQYAAYGNGGTQTYNVSLVATSSNGCSASSAAQTVTVIKRPNANLAFASNITTSCNSGSTPFNATVLNNSQFTSLATNYSIDWGDGSPILSNNTFVSPVTETHPYTAMGYSNILFTITTSNGCNDTAQYKVFKGSIPSVGLGIQGGTIGCLPQSYTFDVSNVITNTPGTTYNVTVNDNTASVAFTQSTITSTVSHLFNTTSCGTTSGTFTNSFKIEISATNPCGSSAAEVKPIVISEKPVASFSMTPNPRACTNQTVTFTNTSVPPNSAVFTNGNYDCNTNMDVYWAITPSTGWTVSSGSVGISGFVPGSNVVGIQFTQPGNYSITMSASGSAGVCGSDTATRTICITNPIVPAFTVSNNSGCAPLSINTNNTTPQPTCGTNTYSWAVTYSATSLCDNSSAFTFTSGTTASSISPSFQFTNAGTYTITLSVTNVCGTLTTTKTVVVKKKPLATVSPIAGSCLLPYIINPTLTDTNCAANALTYSWTFAGGTPATSTSAAPTNISFASIGNHIVTASVTNECGTTVATTNFTIVPNTPVTVISNPSSICIGASATLTASNASNYSWSPATNLNTTSGATVTASPAITTNYTVTGTSGTCTSNAQVTVTVNPLPAVNISPSSISICAGQNVSLTASGANTYTWLPTTGLSVANAATVAANPTATTLYTVTGISASGCSNTQTINVIVKPLPTVIAGATPQQFCNTNTPVQLAGFSPAGGSWSGTGVTAAGVFTPSVVGVNSTILTYSYTDPGTNCANSATITANVTNPTVANAGSGFSKCINGSAVPLSGFTPLNGTWSGAGVTGNNFNPASAAIGTNILTYSIGSGSCLSTDTIHVIVNPLPAINISPANATLCVGQNVSLTASGANTYSWLPTAGLSVANSASVTATPNATTTYTVTGTSANGCSNSQSVTVTVNPLPTVSAGTSPQQFCNTNTPIQLAGFSPAGGSWSGTGVTTAGVFTPSVVGVNSTILTYSYTDPGTNCTNSATITANVTNPTVANAGNGFSKCTNASQLALTGFTPAGGTWTGAGVTGNNFNPSSAAIGTNILTYSIGSGSCLSTDTINVFINPLPTVNIAPANATLCVGQNISLTASGANTYSWLPTTGLSVANAATVTANPTATTPYTVTGISASGCSNTQTINVVVNPLPTVIAGATPQQFCNTNTPVQLAGFSPAGGSWSGTGVTATGVFTPSVAGVGLITLTYTFTDVNLCVNSSTIIANVSSPQVANAGNGFSKCINASQVALTGFTPSGGTWTGAGIIGNDFNPAGASIGTNILTYSIGAASCLSTDTVHVIVNTLPTLAVSASQTTICAGDSSNLIVSGANTYSWTPSLNVLNPLNDTIVVNPLTTSNYSVIGTDVNGCINTTNINVSVNQLPIVNAGIDMPFCNTNSTNQLSGFIPLNGIWSGNGIDANGLFNPSIPGNGIWDLVYSFEDSNNCTNTDTIKATVTSPELANAGNGFSICTNSSPVTLLGFTPSSGTWTGAGVTGNDFNPASANIGTNILTYSIGAASCLNTDTLNINVVALPVLSVNAIPTTICFGLSTSLTATGASTYLWSPTFGLSATTGSNVSGSPTNSSFYFVVGTDVYGCASKDSVFINVNALPTVSAGLDDQFCNQNIPVQLTGFSPSNGIWSGNGINANGNLTPSVAGLGTFNFIYTFTDINGCVNSDTMLATIVNPVQANAGFDTIVCQSNNTISLVGNPNTGFWSGSTSINSNGIFTPNIANTYTVTYTYGIGTCQTLDTKNILVNPLPLVDIGLDISTCETSPIQTLASNIAGGVWSGNGITNVNTGTFSAMNAGVGIDTISYQITSSSTGCINTDSLLINVHPIPTVHFDSLAVSCLNVPINFNNTTAGNNTFYWTFGDGGNSTLANPTHTYNATGTYTIKLIATSQFSCIDSTQRIINVTEPPISNFAQSINSGCGPLQTSFTNNSIAQFSTYNWSFGNGTNSNLFTPSLANYALGILGDSTYYTTLTVTNNCGVSIHQDSIIVLHEPINSLGLNVNSGCSPLTINFTNITTGSANTYTYNFGNGVISNTNQNSFQQVFTANANDTTFYISLIATNICGVDSLLDSVLIHPNIINAAFNTTPTSGCSPLTVNLTNYSTLNCVYNWDLGDGSVYNQYSVNHTYVTFNNNASYIVKLIINNGCSFDTSSVTINVYPQPNLQFALSTDSICSGKSISCFNTSLSLNNTLWNFGDGNTSNLYSPNHNYTSGGQYQVSLIGTSQTNNCIDTAYKYVTVIPTPEINILPTQITGCQPFELPFVNNTQFADFYSWIFGDGNTSANQNPTHTYDSVGTYGGTFIASNFFNCIDSTQFSVLVNAKPKSDFEITHISNCTMPDTLRLINKSIGSVGYNWDFGNGYNSTNNNPTLIYNLPGNYNIRLIAISTKNCSDTLNKLYKASEPPVADFEPTDASKCEPNILFNNLSLFGSDYYWLFADGTTSDEQNPLHNFKTYDSTLVTLIVNKDSQCPDTITKKVIHDNGSHPIVWIPNCFTPNSDDINDVLELKGYDDCDLYRLRIYDRWGVVIFDTTDLTIKWDGKTNGVFTSEGVYSYIFENFSRQIKTVGKIVLLK